MRECERERERESGFSVVELSGVPLRQYPLLQVPYSVQQTCIYRGLLDEDMISDLMSLIFFFLFLCFYVFMFDFLVLSFLHNPRTEFS